MRFRVGSWLYVLGAFTLTAGAALAGRPEPRPSPAAQAEADLAAHGLTRPDSDGSDLATLAQGIAHDTHVTPFVARSPFRLALANGPLEGAPLAADRARAAFAIIRRELGRYDPDRLTAAGLLRIVIASDLRESGRTISSLPNVAGTLLLDGSVPEAFLARLVHHEIFHFFDFADRERLRENDRWQDENGLFAYGEGGRSVRSARAGDLSDEMPGFLTRYAMSAVEEDKAEVFSLLMTRPTEVRTRATSDGVVRAKVMRLADKLSRVAPELVDVALVP
jgi:hypothetical protein